MPTQVDLILRLFLAAALGGLLGGERELTEQPAGFRTHILVALGAALFAIVSAFGFQAIAGASPGQAVRVDVTRVASQIVVGIGFLGGGAILKYGASIRGLTTAASLWVTAAVGTAVGIGELMIGTVVAGITLVALVGLRPFRRFLRGRAVDRDEYVIDARSSLDIPAMLGRVHDAGATILQLQVSEEGSDRSIRLVVRPADRAHAAELVADIAKDPDVRNVDWVR